MLAAAIKQRSSSTNQPPRRLRNVFTSNLLTTASQRWQPQRLMHSKAHPQEFLGVWLNTPPALPRPFDSGLSRTAAEYCRSIPGATHPSVDGGLAGPRLIVFATVVKSLPPEVVGLNITTVWQFDFEVTSARDVENFFGITHT